MKSVEKYSPDTNSWSPVAEMNHSRAGAGVLSHEGRLYVVGGRGQDNTSLSSVEMYNPQTDTWTMMGAMNTKRKYLAVALVYRDRQRGTTGKPTASNPKTSLSTLHPSTRPSKRRRD